MLKRYTVAQRLRLQILESVVLSRWYLAALVVALGATYLFLRIGATAPTRSHEVVTVRIPPNSSRRAVASILRGKELIRSRTAFQIIARVGYEGRPFVAGTYRIPKDALLFDVLDQLIHGRVATVRVTIPEGFTIAQISERLGRKGVTSEAELRRLARTAATEYGINSPTRSLEGYLFPDTYYFGLEARPEAVIRQMLAALESRVTRHYQEMLQNRGKTLHEILTIASLVEREARTSRDRPLIASVIANRLKSGMPLQIDATVQYAAGRHKTRLLFRDLKIESPYNTYIHRGLPPGPIASPGLESIKAAIDPAKTDYLYYVATPDGGHLFASTFEEHKANIRKVRGG